MNHIPANGGNMTSLLRRSCKAPTIIPTPPMAAAMMAGRLGFMTRGEFIEIANIPAIININQAQRPPISGKGCARLIQSSMADVPPRKTIQPHIVCRAQVAVFNSFQHRRWVLHHHRANRVAKNPHCPAKPARPHHPRVTVDMLASLIPVVIQHRFQLLRALLSIQFVVELSLIHISEPTRPY